MLSQVEWGEYQLQDLFVITGTKSLDSNALEFVAKGINFVGRTFENNGIQGKITRRDFCPNEPFTITATVIGNYKYVKYQKEPYYCSQNINKLVPRTNVFTKWNEQIAYFLITPIQKFVSLYDGQQGGYKLETIKSHKIKLPIKKGFVDFDFMERFVAELEAYLTATGLKNYELTVAEQKALEDFEKQNITWKAVTYKSVFNHIKQGRRLRKEDQLPGTIPFVMAGTTNTGVVGYISNPVASFPKNAITIDIFGNAFYRNYSFGAGDDTGVYWNTQMQYSGKQMLFFASSMEKSIAGKFSYGKKLRSSQSLNIKMYVPVINGNIDLAFMDTLISAIQKLIIKDVVQYSDRKIAVTKQCCKK